MAKKQMYIVWNKNKSEGFVTDSFSDAVMVSTGEFHGAYTSAGSDFRDTYDDEGELELEKVML